MKVILAYREHELGDEQILGSGSFVEEVLKGKKRESARGTSHDFEGNLKETCKKFRVSREQILNKSRTRDISRARLFYSSVLMKKRVNLLPLWEGCAGFLAHR